MADPVSGREPHILKGTGPVELSFSLRMNREVRGHHGIGLYNADGLLIWATAVTGLDLEPGVVDLVHRLPGLRSARESIAGE